MGFFFMFLINSFIGSDFSDGVPAGLLDLGQAPLQLEEEDFLRVWQLQKFLSQEAYCLRRLLFFCLFPLAFVALDQ